MHAVQSIGNFAPSYRSALVVVGNVLEQGILLTFNILRVHGLVL